MNNQELIKGPKFQDLAECLMWCAENKPIWSRQEVESETFEAHEIKSNWVKWFKAIIKPQPIVIEGWVEKGSSDNFFWFTKLEGVLNAKKATLTIHQGEE